MSPRLWTERVEDILDAIAEILWDTIQNDLPGLVEPLKNVL